ncbi:MAG: response regulator transcription factor [Clostridiales bacterium]|jgi:DNA-binding LytR/AlgR family response regulator|nr:response regulator transcription factor [Clostridiales bacterium]
MMRIAVCDDDLRELARASDLLNQYRAQKNAALKYDTFSNALELLDAMKRHAYDVLLLDVMMPGLDGLAAAQEIRGFDTEVKIIFLSSSPEFAVDSYAVSAHYYLLKPGTSDKLFALLDGVLAEKSRAAETLCIRQPSGLMRLPLGRIEFLEVCGKKLMFHSEDGSIKEIRGAISDYESRLPDRFIKVHRSFIVNMEYIETLNAREIITCAGRIVPVSRLLYNKVREAYMQFLFDEKGVE